MMMMMIKKEYAIVTQKTVDQYPNSEFESGNMIRIENRTEKNKRSFISLTTPIGLPGVYEERFFDLYAETNEERKSKRLERALIELAECMFDEDSELQNEMERASKGMMIEDSVELLQGKLCEMIDNHAGPELEAAMRWIEPF